MATTWKDKLGAAVPEDLAREIDIFETEIELRKQGKIDEKVFTERRLRRGAYGQRYDNGKRNDGTKIQDLNYPSGDATKGPNTMWDAPGMQRIKIPFGGVTAAQLDVLADVADGCGLDAAMIRKLLDSDADVQDIRARDAWAREHGVTGVPTFIVGQRHAVPGAQPTDLWVKVLKDLIAEADASA